MLAAWTIGLILAVVSIVIHYEALHQIALRIGQVADERRRWVVLGVILLFLTHGAEIWLFAGGYIVADLWLDIGDLRGNFDGEIIEYVYYSSMTYTTVGYGDIHPTGAIRTMAGIEALVGLMMIAWSGAFTVFFLQPRWARDSHMDDK